MKYLNGSRRQPTDLEIEEVEAAIGCTLNAKFIEFLTENNGGVPRKKFFNEYFIQVLYPLCTDANPNILSETSIELLKMRYLEIGIINTIRLVINGDSGEVYADDRSSLHLLADDIVSFFDQLKGKEDEEEDLITYIGNSGDLKLLRTYLEVGNDINKRSKNNSTLIMIAALNEDMAMVNACVELRASVQGVRETLERTATYDFMDKLEEMGILN